MIAAVSLQNVSKTFGQGSANETVALQDINLTVEAGEFVSLIGPSGCGKSTLLRLVGDLLLPTGGEIRVNGKGAHQARLDQDYGMVFQAPVLYEWRRVLSNVALPLELRGVKKAIREQQAQELLDMVELSGFERHYPWQLSGGMQQRAAIARALATKPSILLMDEPFGALDEMTRERMNMELQDIWQHTHTTVLFVTHSISEAVFLSSRVVVLSARPGRIIEIIPVGLPVPRHSEMREDPQFFQIVNRLREALRSAETEAP